jgi:hypothetical protein
MALKLFDRIGTMLKADAHGIVESLEERSLVLKQHLREAELEVNRKRARLEAVREEEKRLVETLRRREDEIRALDEDVTLALGGGKDDLARFAIRRLLPRRAGCGRSRPHRDARRGRALAERVEDQQQQLDALRTRVRPSSSAGIGMRAPGGRRAPSRTRGQAQLMRQREAARWRMIRVDSFRRNAFAAWRPRLDAVGVGVDRSSGGGGAVPRRGDLALRGRARQSPPRASMTLLAGLAGGLLRCRARGLASSASRSPGARHARSGFLHRTAPARAVAVEAGLLVGGLLFARFLAAGSLATTLAVWGFFLVQGCWFLVGGIVTRDDGRNPDPFEDACARATEVLERPVG